MRERLTVELTELPEPGSFEPGIRRAPDRGCTLNRRETKIALANALRYVPVEHHSVIAPEFLEELRTRGRIYGYRYRPHGRLEGCPIDSYTGKITEARAMQVMIENNLDFNVALIATNSSPMVSPGRFVRTGCSTCSSSAISRSWTTPRPSWSVRATPSGLFPSRPEAPRAIITNGQPWSGCSTPRRTSTASPPWAASTTARSTALAAGCTSAPRASSTAPTSPCSTPAGSISACHEDGNLAGHTFFVTSGLGGTSGAQPKALEISGACGDRRRGRRLADRDPPLSGVGRQGHGRSRHLGRLDARCGRRRRTPVHRLPRQHRRSPRVPGRQRHRRRPDLGPDLVPRAVRRRLLPGRGRLRRHARSARQQPRSAQDPGEREPRPPLQGAQATHHHSAARLQPGRVDLSEGFIDLAVYGPHIMGPDVLRLRLRTLPLGLFYRTDDLKATDRAAMAVIDPTRRGQDRDNWQWIRDAEANALVVGTRPAFSTPTPRGGPWHRPTPSTGWSVMAKSGP